MMKRSIFDVRTSLGLSQFHLARICGVSERTIRRIEAGHSAAPATIELVEKKLSQFDGMSLSSEKIARIRDVWGIRSTAATSHKIATIRELMIYMPLFNPVLMAGNLVKISGLASPHYILRQLDWMYASIPAGPAKTYADKMAHGYSRAVTSAERTAYRRALQKFKNAI